jgi:hypothetical protein
VITIPTINAHGHAKAANTYKQMPLMCRTKKNHQGKIKKSNKPELNECGTSRLMSECIDRKRKKEKEQTKEQNTKNENTK